MIRSTPVRLAIVFTGVFILGSLISTLIAWRVIDSELESVSKREIESHYQSLQQAIASSTLSQAIDTINEIERHNVDGLRLAMLVAADGNVIAGKTYARILPEITRSGWSLVSAEKLNEEAELRILGGQSGNYQLYAGASTEELVEVTEIMFTAFAWSTLVVVAISIGGAALAASRFRQRLDPLKDTLRAVANGKLAARIAISDRNDDLDALGRDVNMTLNQLETSISIVQQISTDIAHDLRTPLGRLRITIEQAATANSKGENVQTQLADALDGCDRIANTFSALLRISKLESGERRSHFKPVNLGRVLSDTVLIFEEIAEDTGNHVSLHNGLKSDSLVNGDPELLVQMFVNLIQNAFRHGVSDDTRVMCTISRQGDQTSIIIADNGPGIPAHEHENVLRRLYRLETNRTTPGSGLGLSLVKAVADLHGATLHFEDNSPGLRVVLQFPLVTGPVTTLATHPATKPARNPLAHGSAKPS